MAWYNGTYSCGHEGRTQIYGPHKHRQWKADKHFSKMCPECWEKHLEEERQRKNEESAKKAKEMELPELTGSEKQIAWANTIRQEMMKRAEKEVEDYCELKSRRKPEYAEKYRKESYEALNYMLKNKTKASWYIDNRNEGIRTLLEKLYEEIPAEKEIIEQKLEAEIRAEAIVQPENVEYMKVAEINAQEDEVSVYYPKNDDFYHIVKKELNYRWSGSEWYKKINYSTGTVEDRAAELGNKLLNAGFSIMILDEEIRQKAINADYEPEHHRWIAARTSGDYEGWFSISWPYDDNMYSEARSLPESRYSRPNVVIKPEYYIEIQEFAEIYDFKLSPGAKKLIEQEEEKGRIIEEKSMKVNPVESIEVEQKEDGLKAILNSSDEILEDLKDD